jgi:hypothetical protein
MTGPEPCESLRAAIRDDLERLMQAERATPTPDRAALSGYRQLLQEHAQSHVRRQSAAG